MQTAPVPCGPAPFSVSRFLRMLLQTGGRLYHPLSLFSEGFKFSSSTTWDRSATHPKFDPIGVRTHNLEIMTVHFKSLRRLPYVDGLLQSFFKQILQTLSWCYSMKWCGLGAPYGCVLQPLMQWNSVSYVLQIMPSVNARSLHRR